MVLSYAVVQYAALVLSACFDIGLQERLNYNFGVRVMTDKQKDVLGVFYLKVGYFTHVREGFGKVSSGGFEDRIFKVTQVGACEGFYLFVFLQLKYTDFMLSNFS